MAAKNRKTPGSRFVKGSYALPRFVTSKEDYDSIETLAILRMDEDDKIHYYGIDEETGEEYEILSDDAWADFHNLLMQGAMSHDIIPACTEQLEADGWKESECDFEIFNRLVLDMCIEYEDDFQYSCDLAEELERLPKTHDDWFIELLDLWQQSKTFMYVNLAQNEENTEFYPNLRNLGDRELCFSYNDEYIINYLNDVKRGIEKLKNKSKKQQQQTQDGWQQSMSYLIGLTPYRQTNQLLRDGLVELKSLYPEVMSKILTGIVEYFKNMPCSYNLEIEYRDSVLDFIHPINQSAD
ncbi:hypothetical protein [Arthrospira platensis]|uniref:Uncharacterized protein n=1 Tax=Limnospira platensis NIES-46 TaxID=1236695 RepID=A0A5M3T3H8_LIMPL|nr:hypothetical protein [Arthrospira platensis]AMW27023.1 hypothetical protein AP285_02500 [Arthrospira platensis YZ]KDR59029.1 hypothetical protein APPUASWS_001635 [Arthrospira platensis str. Paraca]MBD2671724.1 hypothetical protein [Arthrospira platensis FACHB-439]MBD2713227.1 hypothetical protein [Arthrospira platensis FACHB-835]MDF2213431.1 hypothetical protein [Arthrospira platensis NCB002]MDT9185189.1 hypothetical protein [Limnospira sp. PMC 289.06]MDT9297377.1 hypothetical protein [Ar